MRSSDWSSDVCASDRAEVWRRHPDLPASSPADSRLARMRDRAAALRPVIDAMRTVTEAERHVRNFAFTAAQIGEGKAASREAAILRGRDLHGYDWDLAVRYADRTSTRLNSSHECAPRMPSTARQKKKKHN